MTFTVTSRFLVRISRKTAISVIEHALEQQKPSTLWR